MILTQVVYIDNILRNTAFIPNFMFSEETEPQIVSSNDFLKDLQWFWRSLEGQGVGLAESRQMGAHDVASRRVVLPPLDIVAMSS